MSFLAPLFLAGAAAAAIPIVLHLLKRDPQVRVKFPAVRLLKRAPVEDTQRHHLRELILLALRVAALLLLALAFARPFFSRGAAASSSAVTVVALDTSYSLSAPGRFERAQRLALDAIDRAPAGSLVGVVTFADAGELAVKPTADRVLARSAVNEAAAGFGSTRYRAALSSAAQSLGGRPGTIVVVTDLQESGWDAGDRAVVPEGARVEIADVGPLPPNLAVVGVRPTSDRIVAAVRNAAPVARDVRVRLAVDGRPAGEAAASVGSNQTAEVSFAGVRGRAIAVSVDDPQGLQADNTRYALLDASAGPPVAVVTGSGDPSRDAFYVQHALAAAALQDVAYRAEGVSGAKLSALSEGDLRRYAVVLLLSTRGLERRGRELLASYAQSGGGMLIAAGPDIDGDVVADVLGRGAALRIAPPAGARQGERTLAPADVRHPVFRPFASTAATLGLVTFRSASRIGGEGCQTIARFTTGDPALLDCPAGEGRALVLASDLDNRWNDFPLHPTFLPFLHEAVRYLGSGRAQPSEYLVADAPAGVPRTPGVVAAADARRPGSTRPVAVNVDPRECDPARLTVEEFRSAVTHMKDAAPDQVRAEARQQEDAQHLWQYAVALMAIALVVEGLLAARTA